MINIKRCFHNIFFPPFVDSQDIVYLKLALAYRLEGLAHKVLQWYLCRMEGWFAADAETISLKCWDQASFYALKNLDITLLA